MPRKVAFWGRDGDKYGKGGRFFFSPRKKMKMSFPERTGPYHHPSLTCTHTGRLTKVPEEPSSAKGSFDTENKLRPKVTEPEHGRTKQPRLQTAEAGQEAEPGWVRDSPLSKLLLLLPALLWEPDIDLQSLKASPRQVRLHENSSSSVSYFGEK